MHQWRQVQLLIRALLPNVAVNFVNLPNYVVSSLSLCVWLERNLK